MSRPLSPYLTIQQILNRKLLHAPEENKKTVLLVEDSPLARERISSILNELGCAVFAAEDGVEGLKQARDQSGALDLIVLDIQMPRMDGITVLRFLRKLPAFAATPIVMLTTQADKETVRTALVHKANDFIRKDASIQHITDRLTKHLHSGAQNDPTDPADLAAQVMRNCRKYRPREKGPYILFYEASMDIQALSQGKDRELLHFYQNFLKVLGHFNKAYPGLELGYSIEHETEEVSRLLKTAEEPVGLVMISGRHQGGFSLARMIGFTHRDKLPIFLVCESIAALAQDQRDGISKMGVELLERRELNEAVLGPLVEKHLVPAARGG